MILCCLSGFYVSMRSGTRSAQISSKEDTADLLVKLMLGTSSSSKGNLNWGVHSRALTELLRSRGQQQFRTKTGRQLFQLSYHNIVREACH